ncbi:hypothetical protein ACHAPT_011229 [Fusarium lateritium]
MAAGLLLLTYLLPVHSSKINSRDDLLETSKSLASDLISFYNGNETGQTPGLLPVFTGGRQKPDTYYWYQSGAFMSTYIDYWQLTGDETYNELVTQGILHQVGQNKDFIPANQTFNIANDDQAIWAMGALTAAEYGFPGPANDEPQWLDLAKAVFETQRLRWDAEVENKTCGGGLRWQIVPFNTGYDAKTAQANTLFLTLGARLARQTGNKTYAEYADKAWNWLYDIEFIDHKTWSVYDATGVGKNCSNIQKVRQSGAAGSLILGMAYMYNYTDGSESWRSRLEPLMSSFLDTYFKKDGRYYDSLCPVEGDEECPRDLITFKALTHRWLAVTSQIAPFTAETILKTLRKSAEAFDQDKDGEDALEQTLSELAMVSNLLISDAYASVTWGENKSKAGGNDSDSEGADSSSDDEDEENSATRFTGLNLLLALLVWALYFM